MVQRVNVVVLCDIDQQEVGASPVTIAVNGVSYEIDLCEDHLNEMNEVLEPFLSNARRQGRGPRRKPSASRTPTVTPPPGEQDSKEYRAQVRAWAQEAGYNVGERGRIAAEIVAAYEEAHG